MLDKEKTVYHRFMSEVRETKTIEELNALLRQYKTEMDCAKERMDDLDGEIKRLQEVRESLMKTYNVDYSFMSVESEIIHRAGEIALNLNSN